MNTWALFAAVLQLDVVRELLLRVVLPPILLLIVVLTMHYVGLANAMDEAEDLQQQDEFAAPDAAA